MIAWGKYLLVSAVCRLAQFAEDPCADCGGDDD